MASKGKVGIVGSGLIGRSWSMLFASVGYQVVLYDSVPAQIENALKETEKELKSLESKGLLRGKLNASEQFALISGTTDIKEMVKGAIFIQECIPERLDWKQALYKQLDEIVDEQTILSSSTSTFLPSLFSKDLKHRSNIIVSHPVNPPYYVPLVEVVPAPWTKPEVMKKTRAIMEEIGQKPVVLSREIEGFVLNRIQYAILNETWRLVQSGIVDVKDVDSVMSDGLGMRYAFLGPLETAHLNAEGMTNYFERYTNTIYAVSETMGPTPKMEGPTAVEIAKQLELMVPLDKLQERRNYRDNCLTQLSILKRKLNE
ncbi:lambda-crystallin homolog [Anastrepha obliqua]|uniref:lambda-crystallin homolog n=1 Tax=Anastrepha obliqua TaxID=95512 RepID=UPI0024096FD0|nr:lambda-crystallin homolog [Anastrepha obliqua]